MRTIEERARAIRDTPPPEGACPGSVRHVDAIYDAAEHELRTLVADLGRHVAELKSFECVCAGRDDHLPTCPYRRIAPVRRPDPDPGELCSCSGLARHRPTCPYRTELPT